MRANIKYAVPSEYQGSIGFWHANAATRRFGAGRCLAILGIVLMLPMLLAGQSSAASQDTLSTDGRVQNLDPRWLPWIGSWSLVPDTVKTTDGGEGPRDYILDIQPGDDGRSVAMKGSQDEKVLYDKKNVIVDGSRRPIEDEGCEGWYTYRWSDTGKRLLFESEVTCSDNRMRTISGISAFTNPGEWVDIQLLVSGEDRVITLRRYRQAGGNPNIPFARSTSRFARAEAGTGFSADEIIELTDKVAPEVIEAALVEMNKPFEINSEVLLRLADADVPSQIVDLMVALSFPDKFTVERPNAQPSERPVPRERGTTIVYAYSWSPFGMWSYCDPFFPWYWSSPAYLYGYWGWGGYYPIYGPPGGGYRISGGRLIAGQGYSRVYPGGPKAQPRYAQPRSSSSRGVSRSASSGSAAGRTSSSSGSGSRTSSGGTRSGGGSPSASPGGYRSGGGSGRTARPR